MKLSFCAFYTLHVIDVYDSISFADRHMSIRDGQHITAGNSNGEQILRYKGTSRTGSSA